MNYICIQNYFHEQNYWPAFLISDKILARDDESTNTQFINIPIMKKQLYKKKWHTYSIQNCSANERITFLWNMVTVGWNRIRRLESIDKQFYLKGVSDDIN